MDSHHVPQGTADTQCFTYDALRRLTEAWTPGSGNCTPAPTVAGLGGAAPYWQSWTYDTTGTAGSIIGSTGNRLTETDHAAAGDTTTSYTYPLPGSGQPHAPANVTTSGPGGTTSGAYSYDKNGRTTSRPGPTGPQTLTWTPGGRLATLTAGAATYSYVYAADGARLMATDPTGTTLYMGDTQLRLTASTQVKTATRYYTYNGQTIGERTAAGLQFLTGDPHGTSFIAVADTPAQTDTHRYQTPFGDPRGPAVAWTGTKSCVGGDLDPTGLVHEGAREYDPLGGRFISPDPITATGDPQQINAYAYADGNPVGGSDPSGLMVEDAGGGAGGTGSFVQVYGNGTILTGSMNFVTGKVTLAVDGLAVSLVDVNHNPFKYAASVDKTYGAYQGGKMDDRLKILASLQAGCTGDKGEQQCFQQFYNQIGSAVTARSLLVSGCDSACQEELRDQGWGMAGGLMADGSHSLAGGSAAVSALFADEEPNTMGALQKIVEDACTTMNSFAPATEVLMDDCSTKPIRDVEVGDEVLATDPATGETTGEPVTLLHANQDRRMTDLTVSTPSGVRTIHTTDEHPFWDAGTNRWTGAGLLVAGDVLRTVDGPTVRVIAVHNWSDRRVMLNLTVERIHTYYVMAGSTPVLVYNSGCGVTSAIGGDSYLTKAAQQAGTNQRVQQELDNLQAQLASGNLNPGIGTKSLTGTDVSYARGANGARLFFRNVDGVIQIVGKASKANESGGINRLMQLYGQ